MDTLWTVGSSPVLLGGDLWFGMKGWIGAARSVRDHHPLHPIDFERCATAQELRVLLAVRGFVTAANGRAKEARLRWRRWVHGPQASPKTTNDPIATTTEVERRKAWHERARLLRRDARVARKIARQAQRTYRLYTVGFWLAREIDPRRTPRALTSADPTPPELLKMAWGHDVEPRIWSPR